MDKVYLVWLRDYENSLMDEVVKVFDSKDKAEMYIEDYIDDDGLYYEEREVE